MSWIITTIIVPILVLSILIFVHEFGHFIVAKWCGVGVIKFSIGFGPAIFKFVKGETIYQLSLIPLGGFVRMVGDMPDIITGEQKTDQLVREEEQNKDDRAQVMLNDRSRWFLEKGFWSRSAIVFAGPLANFLFSIVVLFFIYAVYGRVIADKSPIVGFVATGSPAENAGMISGDRVKAVDGKSIESWDQLANTIHHSAGNELKISISRDENEDLVELKLVPKISGAKDPEGQDIYLVGIGPNSARSEASLVEAIKYASLETGYLTLETYYGLWGMFRGEVSPKDLAGPLFIFDITTQQAKKGFENLLRFMSRLSVSLGALNLLPIPVLDGGHLLFFMIEAFIGPIAVRKKEIAQQVGVVLLLSLMIFAMHNDFTRKPININQSISWEQLSNTDNKVKEK